MKGQGEAPRRTGKNLLAGKGRKVSKHGGVKGISGRTKKKMTKSNKSLGANAGREAELKRNQSLERGMRTVAPGTTSKKKNAGNERTVWARGKRKGTRIPKGGGKNKGMATPGEKCAGEEGGRLKKRVQQRFGDRRLAKKGRGYSVRGKGKGQRESGLLHNRGDQNRCRKNLMNALAYREGERKEGGGSTCSRRKLICWTLNRLREPGEGKQDRWGKRDQQMGAFGTLRSGRRLVQN